jgi:hypothetical protein
LYIMFCVPYYLLENKKLEMCSFGSLPVLLKLGWVLDLLQISYLTIH